MAHDNKRPAALSIWHAAGGGAAAQHHRPRSIITGRAASPSPPPSYRANLGYTLGIAAI
ncbi:MAG: hypothetical protein OXU71_02960 [Gammaproteobacteria bacterium]|nr:hypothetical protein [Gammaproteobacteria bacterium]